MDAIKVGNYIKELRKKNNLTQNDLASKYGVTYQAVSKWERGINIPDISLLKKMSDDFNINIEDILNGEIKSKKEDSSRLIYPYVFGIIGLILIGLLIFLLVLSSRSRTSFSFKTLSTSCKEFKVTGTIAYNHKKSSINISNIDYCGGDDNNIYDTISCELYEEEKKEKVLIAQCNKTGKKQKLEEYLNEVEVRVDDYEQKCKGYTDNQIYLEIKASKDNKTVVYKVDLDLNNNCPIKEESNNDGN